MSTAYTARCRKCGSIVAISLNCMSMKEDNAKSVTEWLKRGYSVALEDAVRAKADFIGRDCKCRDGEKP